MLFRVLRIAGLMFVASMAGPSAVYAGYLTDSDLGGAYITIDGGSKYFADWAGTSQITPASPANEMFVLNQITGLSPAIDAHQYRVVRDDNSETGTNALGYSTQWLNSDLGKNQEGVNATISWDGTANYINYASQILFVRDGNNAPYWYAFNLGATEANGVGAGWHGKTTISLNNFWVGKGNISHASIYTGGSFSEIASPITQDVSAAVPEPSSIAMLVLGAIGLVIAGRKCRQMKLAA